MKDLRRRGELAKHLRAGSLQVEEYESAQEFLIDKSNHEGGVVVGSVKLMELRGLQVVDTLKREAAVFPIVLLAGPPDIPKAIQCGVDFASDLRPESVLAAVLRTTSPDVFDEKDLRSGFERLTEREAVAMTLTAKGLSGREIGASMGISPKTVDAHRSRIMEKTGTHDVAELLRMWRAWKALQ